MAYNPFNENATDPTGTKEDAFSLASRIEQNYHSAGYTWVRVKVLTIPVYNGNGDRVGSRYELSSNIRFDTSKYVEKSVA